MIGVGTIGSLVAQRAHAFDMNAIGVDPKDLPPNQFVQRMVLPDRLEDVLPLADVLFVCAPLTPESKRTFGARQFGLMKQGSYFVAVSRGGLYDLGALVEALRSKRLAAAMPGLAMPRPLVTVTLPSTSSG